MKMIGIQPIFNKIGHKQAWLISLGTTLSKSKESSSQFFF
jgi:hypothetical protein